MISTYWPYWVILMHLLSSILFNYSQFLMECACNFSSHGGKVHILYLSKYWFSPLKPIYSVLSDLCIYTIFLCLAWYKCVWFWAFWPNIEEDREEQGKRCGSPSSHTQTLHFLHGFFLLFWFLIRYVPLLYFLTNC